MQNAAHTIDQFYNLQCNGQAVKNKDINYFKRARKDTSQRRCKMPQERIKERKKEREKKERKKERKKEEEEEEEEGTVAG